MRGLYLEPSTPVQHRENLRVVSAAVDHLYDAHHLFEHNANLVTATSGTVGPAGSVIPAIIMAPGVTSTARWIFPVLPRHVRSTLRLTIYYSSPAGSTNNFGLTTSADAHNPSGILSGKVTVGAVTAANYPGPATANHLATATILMNAATFSSASHLFLKVALTRGAADANAGDFAFIYGLLEVLPT
jgi:hypothetical protein